MSEPVYAKRLLDFVFEAGRISLKHIDNAQQTLKSDNSVLTIADKKISELLHEKLRDLVQSSRHLIIDEEDPKVTALLDQKLLDKAEYIWVCDPIDGTRAYSNGMPQYGVSLGLLKNGRPWMGAVYFPMMDELFFADGKDAWFIRQAFSSRETRRKITRQQETISHRSILLCDTDYLRNHRYDYKDAQLMISETSIIDLTWPAIGRGCGAIFCSRIWDFAGCWPIFEAAGLQLRDVTGGRVMDRLEVSAYQPNWKLRDYHILSTEANFPVIRAKFTAA